MSCLDVLDEGNVVDRKEKKQREYLVTEVRTVSILASNMKEAKEFYRANPLRYSLLTGRMTAKRA